MTNPSDQFINTHDRFFDGHRAVHWTKVNAGMMLRIIRCFPNTPKASFETYPNENNFDIWTERTRHQWAAQNGIDPAKLQVICALALVHS